MKYKIFVHKKTGEFLTIIDGELFIGSIPQLFPLATTKEVVVIELNYIDNLLEDYELKEVELKII